MEEAVNEAIARALLEFVTTLKKINDAILANPDATATSLAALIGAIESVLENYRTNEYEDTDREIVRSLLDFAAAEVATTVLVAGTVVLAAPSAGIVAIAVTSFATGEFLADWLETNRFSFYPSLQDASSATQPVTLYGYSPTDDTLISSSFDDMIYGFGGSDYIVNPGGSDVIFGGAGSDILDYSLISFASTNGIIVDTTAGDGSFIVHHHSDTDTVTSVETVIGTALADRFVLGNFGANVAGGGHIADIQAGAGNDLAYLHNAGGSGPRRVAIDGGADLDVIAIADDGFATEIDFSAGTVRYQGGPNAQFAFSNFEGAMGGGGSDIMLGSDVTEYLKGNDGADRLFGGSGDGFIFFDAADTHVNGGAGRDSAWAIGPDAIDADMVAWAMEVLSGGSGADTITMSGSDSLMAAGGDGDDVFNLNANNNEGLRFVWGGDGADVINFAVDYAVEWFDRQVGILVVNVIGLTVDSFATLTPDMLGLDGINLSKIHCIILNPDANDQVQFDGITMNSEDYEFFNDDIGSGPNGSGTNGFFFGTRASPFLGDELVIQGVFVEEGWAEHLFSQDLEYYQVMVTPTSTTVIPSDEFGGMRWSSQQMVWVPFDENDPEVQVNVTRIQSEAAEYFAVLGTEPYLVQEAGDRPEWPWFVAGGNFSGNSLVTDNSISATLTDPPNTLISDWLLVA